MRKLLRGWVFALPIFLILVRQNQPLPVSAESPETQAYYIQTVDDNALGRRAIENQFSGAVIEDLSAEANVLVVQLSAEQAKTLQTQRHAGIGLIEPVPAYSLASENYPYAHQVMQTRPVWDADQDDMVDANSFAGSGMRICVIDTGIATNHKDFDGMSITGSSQIVGEDWEYDPSGHGTHLGGIIAARLQGSGIVGIAPQASLHFVKMFDYGGNWVSGQSNLVSALVSCKAAGAEIVSLSIASCSSPSQIENSLLDYLYQNDNMFFVSAAGNSQNSCGNGSLAYPASFDSVVSVGAVDEELTLANFSQQNNKIELAAPGVGIVSTWPTPNNGGIHQYAVTDAYGNRYEGDHMAQSAYGEVQATLVDGGLCDSADINPAWQNAIVLCERGTITFADKVTNSEANGSVGTIIYNNASGAFLAGLGANASSNPVILLTQADGVALSAQVGTTVDLVSDLGIITGNGGYIELSGTSQSAAYVAGAAAVVWTACPQLSNNQLRAHLSGAAELPKAARSTGYGRGIVQLSTAVASLFDGVDTYAGLGQLGVETANAECSIPNAVTVQSVAAVPIVAPDWILISTISLSIITTALCAHECLALRNERRAAK